MLTKTRQQNIYEIIKKHGSIKIADLHTILSVSEMTIRRDLDDLAKDGLIERVHGGAIISGDKNTESTFSDRLIANYDLKKMIAKYAVSLIKKNSSIFLDGSTTCNELAQYLPEDHNLVVFTNSIEVISGLKNKKGLSIVSLGGELALDYNTLDGALAIENAEKIMVDNCFFSGGGFNTMLVSNAGLIGSLVKKVMINNSKNRYLLADSTKYGSNGLIELCKWDKVDMLITDWKLPAEACESLKSQGVKLVLAGT